VLGQARELHPRDLRLPRLDRIEDGERAERILGRRPRADALGRLGARRAVRVRVERRGELVPEIDVLRLFGPLSSVALAAVSASATTACRYSPA
jgi:hypothetical protein